MTKHNLGDNLGWLLRYDAFAELSLSHTAGPIDDSNSNIAEEEPPTQTRVQLLPDDIDGAAEYIPRSPTRIGGADALDVPDNMARLQLAPASASNRKTLVQGKTPLKVAVPAAAGSSHAASRSRQDATPATPLISNRTGMKTPATLYDDSIFDGASDVLDIDDIEENDLMTGEPTTSSFGEFGTPTTIWERNAATRPEPLQSKRGRKRKSDEYAADLGEPRSTQKPQKRHSPRFSPDQDAPDKHEIRPSNQRAANADSTRKLDASTSHIFDLEPLAEDFGQWVDEEESITETTVRTAIRRTRSSAQLPPVSLANAAPHRQCSTQPEMLAQGVPYDVRRSPPKKIIEDSENDEDDVVTSSSKVESDKMKFQGNMGSYQLHASPSTVPLKPLSQQTPILIRKTKTEDADDLPKIATSMLSTSSGSIKESSSCPGTQISMGKGLSDEQKLLLKRLLKISADSCEKFLAQLESLRRQLNEQRVEYMAEGDEEAVEVVDQKRRLVHDRVSAMKEFKTQKDLHATCVTRREGIKARVLSMFHENPDHDGSDSTTLAFQAELLSLKAQLEAAERRLLHLWHDLSSTEVPGATASSAQPTPSLSLPNPSPAKRDHHVLVGSTQLPATRTPIKTQSPTPGFGVQSTQSVTQTPTARRNNIVSRPEPLQTTLRKGTNDSSVERHQAGFPPYGRQLGTTPTEAAYSARPRGALQDLTDADAYFSSSRKSPQRHGSRMLADGGSGRNDFTRSMGSPLQRASNADCFDDDFDFGELDDFDPSLADPLPTSMLAAPARGALSDMSANIRRDSQLKSRPGAPGPSKSALKQYPWSSDVMAAMTKRFHLQGFRHNQLEAINATLSGKDAFVLMPTGGGKSLCYQLPSIINSGRTRGVTVVISPLLSLMQDQVDHLQKLNIQAFLINSEVTAEHRKFVLQALRDPKVEQLIQLLYVTPEMLSKSQAIVNTFELLHSHQRLARIVIDEAHCVSQWGHDFRPDYKALGEVRRKFAGVPVMALTATATENVKVDVIHNLGMDGCDVFTQSFNRPNLAYEVRVKSKGVLDSIAELIKDQYMRKSGIIYCLSRAQCEKIAKQLQDNHGIQAKHYHAGMEAQDRTDVQKKWQAGKCHVIVATIAFGMGIDKPDVRFVIHHTIPKSLEGYYQETGRAGRDGKKSGCYLFYGYGDTSSIKRMISEGEGSWEQKERQKQMLRNMVQFCENRSDCRRVQVLAYFNEAFDRKDCDGACDNCNSDSRFEVQDFTTHAQKAIQLVQRLKDNKVTLLHCVDIYRGVKGKTSKTADPEGLQEYGAGADLERGDVERLFYRLLSEDALEEFNVLNTAGFASQYVKLGRKCREFETGQRPLQIQVRVSPSGRSKGKAPERKPRKRNAANDYPTSTIVSSPIVARASRRQAPRDQFEGSNEGEEDLAEFAAVRRHGEPRNSKKHEVGPPIVRDQMEDLDQHHREIVQGFVEKAKRYLQGEVRSKNLGKQPLSDTVLREVGTRLPLTENALREIVGDANSAKVDHYGAKLLELIREAQDAYEKCLRSLEDNRDLDPNHRAVIAISDDDDDDDDDNDNEDEDEEMGENERIFEASEFDDELEHSETSRYFGTADSLKNSQVFPKPRGGNKTSNYKNLRGRGGSVSGYGRGGKSRASKSRSSSGTSRRGSYSSKTGGGAYKRAADSAARGPRRGGRSRGIEMMAT